MLGRTEDPNHKLFHAYGGRGIKVCPEWRDFAAFARDMGPTFDPVLELDRINVDGDYEPGNCRWATRVAQQNNKRTNHRVEWRGVEHTVKEWAHLLQMKPNTLLYHLRRGWSVERAMTQGVPANVLLPLAAT